MRRVVCCALPFVMTTCTFDGLDQYTSADAATDAVTQSDVAAPTNCGGTTACVPAAPTKWTGPFAIADGATIPTSCPSPLVPVVSGHTQLATTAPTCGTCSCSASTNGCVSGNAAVYSDQSCNALMELTTATTSCEGISTPNTVGSVNIAVPFKSATSCALDGGAFTPGNDTWKADALGCEQPTNALVQADCASGNVCAPTAPTAFESKLCVSQNGDVACPASYTSKRVVYSGFNDTQACSKCSCAPTTPICTGTASLGVYADTNCTNTIVNLGAGSCSAVGSQVMGYSMKVNGLTPVNGTCSVTQATVTGAVAPTGPTTVCCLP